MKKPIISVVIISKNELALADTLAAMRQVQHPQGYEIVVVDASAGKLDHIAAEYPEVVWVNFAVVPGKRIWIPEQRNTGVAKARGEVIVFIDASCTFAPNWLEVLVAPILNENEMMVSGPTCSTDGKSVYEQTVAAHATKKYIDECGTNNLAFKRQVFDAVGGFDGRFDYGSDVDFVWRAKDAGYKIRYSADAPSYHDWGDSSREAKRALVYGVARARLYKKHPKKWRLLFTRDIMVVVYALYILGLPLTIFWWPYPLLLAIPLLKNIGRQPIRVVMFHLVYAWGALRELSRVRSDLPTSQ